MDIYLVGGAVRDQLLGIPIQEKDWVVTGATPEQMQQLGFKPVGKDFPVFLHPDTHEEYALARTERKQGRGYKGFTFYYDENLSLEEDLIRRDLTINAIAMDHNGHLIDPYGGYHDLQHRVLRHVSGAFIEDPLRILRIARFMAQLAPFGFHIHPETQQLLKSMVASGELHALTPERVWREFERALNTTDPSAFIETLRACGALADLFPELASIHDLEARLLNFNKNFDRCAEALQTADIRAKFYSFQLPSIRFAFIMYLLSCQTNASVKNVVLQEFCQQWPVAKAYRELAALVVHYLPSVTALPITAPEIVAFCQKTDALRRPQRFIQFLLVSCSARQTDLALDSSSIQTSSLSMTRKECLLLNALIELNRIDLKKHVDFNQVTNFPEAILRCRCDILEKWLKSNAN